MIWSKWLDIIYYVGTYLQIKYHYIAQDATAALAATLVAFMAVLQQHGKKLDMSASLYSGFWN